MARVTLAFFDRYVLGEADALDTMTRDGNVTGTPHWLVAGSLRHDAVGTASRPLGRAGCGAAC